MSHSDSDDSRSAGSFGIVILSALLVIAVGTAVIFWLKKDRSDVAEISPARPPIGQAIDRWADSWVERAKEARVIAPDRYNRQDFLRDLVNLLSDRDKISSFRDAGTYQLLSGKSAADEIARTPAVKALFLSNGTDDPKTDYEFNPTLLLANLDQAGRFVEVDPTGLPKSIAKLAVETTTNDQVEVIMMRRRLRERTHDLLAIAKAAAKIVPPSGFPARQPVLAWARSLDIERLEGSDRSTPPGTIPMFSPLDLAAAEVVSLDWPSESALRVEGPMRPATASSFRIDPFAPSSPAMMDGLRALDAGAKQEIPRIPAENDGDRKAVEALRQSIEDLLQREDDRELGIYQANWRLQPTD